MADHSGLHVVIAVCYRYQIVVVILLAFLSYFALFCFFLFLFFCSFVILSPFQVQFIDRYSCSIVPFFIPSAQNRLLLS